MFTHRIIPAAVGIAFLALSAGSITAQSTSESDFLSCMREATERKEEALLDAVDTYYADRRAAIAERADKRIDAWDIFDGNDRRTALREADKDFRAQTREIERALDDTEDEAGDEFRTSERACNTAAREATRAERVTQTSTSTESSRRFWLPGHLFDNSVIGPIPSPLCGTNVDFDGSALWGNGRALSVCIL